MSEAGDRAVRERLEWEARWAERDAARAARRVPFRDRVFRLVGCGIVAVSAVVIATAVVVIVAVAVERL